MTKNGLYRKALTIWGYDRQLCKLAEEASELAAESNRILNSQGFEDKLAGEIADIEIMIEQLRLNGLAHTIDFYKQQKLQQLAIKLGETYES